MWISSVTFLLKSSLPIYRTLLGMVVGVVFRQLGPIWQWFDIVQAERWWQVKCFDSFSAAQDYMWKVFSCFNVGLSTVCPCGLFYHCVKKSFKHSEHTCEHFWEVLLANSRKKCFYMYAFMFFSHMPTFLNTQSENILLIWTNSDNRHWTTGSWFCPSIYILTNKYYWVCLLICLPSQHWWRWQ